MEFISWNMGNKDSFTANFSTLFMEFQSDHYRNSHVRCGIKLAIERQWK